MTGTSGHALPDITAAMSTIIMGLDEKSCLKAAMQDTDVKRRVRNVNEHRTTLINQVPTQNGRDRASLAFSRLPSWQDALVEMGSEMVDRDELYPGQLNVPTPSQCIEMTWSHGGMFKGEEKDKFKCILESKDKSNPPSNGNPRYSCSTPVRRTWKFWEYKTWCELPGWIMDAYQNARISAMVTCGTHSLVATLKSDVAMPDELIRTCMLVEQRMVVGHSELMDYKDFMARE